MPDQVMGVAAVFMALGTLATLVVAWLMRKRPSHERIIALTLFAVVLLGFLMGWVALTLAGG